MVFNSRKIAMLVVVGGVVDVEALHLHAFDLSGGDGRTALLSEEHEETGSVVVDVDPTAPVVAPGGHGNDASPAPTALRSPAASLTQGGDTQPDRTQLRLNRFCERCTTISCTLLMLWLGIRSWPVYVGVGEPGSGTT